MSSSDRPARYSRSFVKARYLHDTWLSSAAAKEQMLLEQRMLAESVIFTAVAQAAHPVLPCISQTCHGSKLLHLWEMVFLTALSISA